MAMSQLSEVAAGRLIGGDAEFSGVTIDSREVAAGELFVAIDAERDGHDFAPSAIDRGAAGCLVARELDIDAPMVVVDGDTGTALTRAATRLRSFGPELVVGVTGSVGKTSVKDLAAAALGAGLRTSASDKSFNNEIGVPLTLLNAPDDAEALVVEMGARGPGQIAELCAVARPRIGVVTRVAAVHTELFGDLDAVAATKGELIESLPRDGIAVLNAADDRVRAMASRTEAKVVLFGEGGDIQARDIELDEQVRPSFEVVGEWGRTKVALPVSGAHQVQNALAALAVACCAGVPLDVGAAGLANAVASPMRMAVHHLDSGATVIDDSYNANPTSMEAGLRALGALNAERRTAVVGTMAELGPDAERAHREIALSAEAAGIELIAVDEPSYGVESVSDISSAVERLGTLGRGDAVLVKASRSAGLDRVVTSLLAADST